MSTVLRWHVGRLYEEGGARQEGDSTPVDVTINRDARSAENPIRLIDPKQVAATPSDNLDWWESDEGDQVDGRTTVEAIGDALKYRNVFSEARKLAADSGERRLREDMVLLQFIRDEPEFDAIWSRLIEMRGLPDVSELAALKKSSWLDFSRQAREMSKTIYRKVMGEKGESEDA